MKFKEIYVKRISRLYIDMRMQSLFVDTDCILCQYFNIEYLNDIRSMCSILWSSGDNYENFIHIHLVNTYTLYFLNLFIVSRRKRAYPSPCHDWGNISRKNTSSMLTVLTGFRGFQELLLSLK